MYVKTSHSWWVVWSSCHSPSGTGTWCQAAWSLTGCLLATEEWIFLSLSWRICCICRNPLSLGRWIEFRFRTTKTLIFHKWGKLPFCMSSYKRRQRLPEGRFPPLSSPSSRQLRKLSACFPRPLPWAHNYIRAMTKNLGHLTRDWNFYNMQCI